MSLNSSDLSKAYLEHLDQAIYKTEGSLEMNELRKQELLSQIRLYRRLIEKHKKKFLSKSTKQEEDDKDQEETLPTGLV